MATANTNPMTTTYHVMNAKNEIASTACYTCTPAQFLALTTEGGLILEEYENAPAYEVIRGDANTAIAMIGIFIERKKYTTVQAATGVVDKVIKELGEHGEGLRTQAYYTSFYTGDKDGVVYVKVLEGTTEVMRLNFNFGKDGSITHIDSQYATLGDRRLNGLLGKLNFDLLANPKAFYTLDLAWKFLLNESKSYMETADSNRPIYDRARRLERVALLDANFDINKENWESKIEKMNMGRTKEMLQVCFSIESTHRQVKGLRAQGLAGFAATKLRDLFA